MRLELRRLSGNGTAVDFHTCAFTVSVTVSAHDEGGVTNLKTSLHLARIKYSYVLFQ